MQKPPIQDIRAAMNTAKHPQNSKTIRSAEMKSGRTDKSARRESIRSSNGRSMQNERLMDMRGSLAAAFSSSLKKRAKHFVLMAGCIGFEMPYAGLEATLYQARIPNWFDYPIEITMHPAGHYTAKGSEMVFASIAEDYLK